MEKSNYYLRNLEKQLKQYEFENADWKEQIIGESIPRFKPKSFYRWCDKNQLTPSLILNYLSVTGDTIDSFTHGLKESFGENSFDEQDIIDFILKYTDHNPFKIKKKMKKVKKVNPIKKSIAAQTVMTAILRKSKPLVNQVTALDIKTADDYSKAALLISNLKMLSKQAEQEKATITTPMREAMKAVDEHFKPFIDQVKQIEADTKQKMVDFIELNEHKSEKLMTDFKNGKIKKLETVVSKQDELKDLDNSSASVRKIKEVIILDVTKIPRKYLTPELIAIKNDLIAGVKIPGCELSVKTSIAI